MTDPDERTINRAIAHIMCSGHDRQDLREEARAALHRLFNDRRRLEREVDSFRKLAYPPTVELTEERDALRAEVEELRRRWTKFVRMDAPYQALVEAARETRCRDEEPLRSALQAIEEGNE